jgi:Response regulator containing a CheY-like receiver domain and an HTH DNA-binding domain
MKILFADDHPLMREGVRHVLIQIEAGVEIVDAYDWPSLFAEAAAHADVDLALVDLNMPGSPGLAGIVAFRARHPEVPLVVLSASESARDIQAVLDAGALGYIPKASPQAVMLSALQLVIAGGVYVPPLLLDAAPGLHASQVADFFGAGANRADDAPDRSAAPAAQGQPEQGHRAHPRSDRGHGQAARRGDIPRAERQQPY